MNTCHSYLKNVPHYLPSSLKVMLLYFPASLGRAVHYLISGVMEKAANETKRNDRCGGVCELAWMNCEGRGSIFISPDGDAME